VCDQFVLGWKKVSLTKSVERKRQSAVFVLFSFSCVCVCITSMRYAIQDNNNKPDCVSNVRVYWLDQVPDILSNERPTIKNQKPRLKKKNTKHKKKERKNLHQITTANRYYTVTQAQECRLFQYSIIQHENYN
jgi:hypothetical protein